MQHIILPHNKGLCSTCMLDEGGGGGGLGEERSGQGKESRWGTAFSNVEYIC